MSEPGMPEHPLDAIRVGLEPQLPVEGDHARVREQRDVPDLPPQQRPHHLLHEGLAQALSLQLRVHQHVPNGGVEGVVAGGAGQADQTRFNHVAARVHDFAGQRGHQERVAESRLHLIQWPPGPPHLDAELLQSNGIHLATVSVDDARARAVRLFLHKHKLVPRVRRRRLEAVLPRRVASAPCRPLRLPLKYPAQSPCRDLPAPCARAGGRPRRAARATRPAGASSPRRCEWMATSPSIDAALRHGAPRGTAMRKPLLHAPSRQTCVGDSQHKLGRPHMLTEETERATVRWLFGEVSLCEDAVSAGRRWPNALVFGEETSNAHLLPSARSFCDAGAMSGLAVARSSAGALPASHFSGVRARPRAHASARRAVVLQSLPTNHSELLKAAVDASRNGSLVAFFDENSDRILLPFLVHLAEEADRSGGELDAVASQLTLLSAGYSSEVVIKDVGVGEGALAPLQAAEATAALDARASPGAIVSAERRAQGLVRELQEVRRSSLVEIIGRKPLQGSPREDAPDCMASDIPAPATPAQRILQALLDLGTRTERQAMLPEAFRPPEGEEGGGEPTVMLWTTPTLLLQAIDLELARLQRPRRGWMVESPPLLGGSTLDVDNRQRTLGELREDVLPYCDFWQ